MLDLAAELELFVLLEAFSVADAERGRALLERRRQHSDSILFGINCRDLTTLEIAFERFASYTQLLPQGFKCVAESGLTSTKDAAQVVDWGYDIALVGSALMAAGNPETTVRDMLAAGRAAGSQSDVR